MSDSNVASPAIADSAVTPERLARLRQLHEVAAPGPWAVSPWHDQLVLPERWINVARDEATPEKAGQFTAVNASRAADAELIAEVRNALPDLLDEVGRYRSVTFPALLDAVHEQLTGKPFPRASDDLDGIMTTEDVANAVWALLHRDLGVSDSENAQ